MKFLKQAVVAALMSLSLIEAKRAFTGKDFDARVKAGKFDKKALLRNAIPYNKALRRMDEAAEDEDADADEDQDEEDYNYDQDEDYNAEYEEYQYDDEEYERLNVTANYRFKFNSCLTLETENYNLLMKNLIYYAKSGKLTSIRNYVLLDVCDGEECYYEQGNTDNVYMVDLMTFIEAVVAYGPNEKESVCEACLTYASVCGKDENGYYYDYDAENENNGERRKLDDGSYKVFDASSCDKCDALDCWYDADGDQEVDAESLEAWIAEIAECRESGAYWNGLELYAGWMCNSDGSGIEVGVFIDQYCRMYHRGVAFTNIMQDDDYQYVYQSQDILPMMFNDVIECKDSEDRTYVDYDTYLAMVENGQWADEDEEEDGDVNEACEAIFNGDFVPRSIGNCGQTVNITQQMIQEADESEYQQQDQDEQGDQNMYQYILAQQMLYNTYGESTDWYTYELSAEAVLDGASICEALSDKWIAGYQEDQDNLYDNSESWWSFNKKGNNTLWRNGNSALQTPSANLSPLEIAWIVLAATVATALFMHYTRKQIIKRKAKKEKEVYVRTDDKGTPLIIS